MTLQDLIDELCAQRPLSVRSANVTLCYNDDEFNILSVTYLDGEVVIDIDVLEDE